MANDHEQLLETARNYLKEAAARRSEARWTGSAEALASIAASLLVLAEASVAGKKKKQPSPSRR
jgi:hypothetical protein